MAENVDVAGRISITDNASPTLKKIEGSIASVNKMSARMGQGFSKAAAGFSKFANTGAFGGVAKNARSAMGAVGKLGSSIVRMGSQLALLAGAAGFGGLAYEMKNYIDTTDQLNKTAARFGIPIEQMQSLRDVAKDANIDMGDLTKSLGILSKGMAGADSGKNKQLVELFAKLGINMRDANGQMRNAADIMPALANAFEKNTNATTRMTMATALFGKGGAQMIDVLVQGGASFRDAMEAVKQYGQITQDQADMASKATTAQFKFAKSIEGVKNSIMAQLLPALLPVIDAMTKWVTANREWLATGIEKFIVDMTTAIKQVDWEGLWQGAQKVGKVLKTVSDAIGGLNTIIPLFIAAIGASMLAPLATVVIALGKFAAAFVTGPIVGVISQLAALVVGLGSALLTALSGAGGAMAAFNAVLAANPIGVVVIAVAALAGAALLIYKNWEPISELFSKMWANIKADFWAVYGWIDDFVAQFHPGGIYGAWADVETYFRKKWADIKAAFWDPLTWLSTFASQFIPDSLKTAWADLGTWFSAKWVEVKDAFWSVTSWMGSVTSMFTPEAIKAAWTGLGAWFSNLWTSISTIFTGAISGLGSLLLSFTPKILIDIWTTTLPQAMEDPWKAVSEVFSSYIASIKRIVLMLVPQPIIDAWSGLAGFFERLWTSITNAFKQAWAAIKPIIDAIMAAIGPVIEAAGKVAKIGGGVIDAGKGAVKNVVGGAGEVASNAWGKVTNFFGGGKAQPPPAGPLQQGAAATGPVTARVEGEVETKIRIDLAPGLTGSAETHDSGIARSQVNLGTTMLPQ
jgi:hypothetical protein